MCIFSLYATTYITTFPGAGDVWFSLNGTKYQNNSIVTLEDIGEGDEDALLCRTNLNEPGIGNWFFPNESRVSSSENGNTTTVYRTRGVMVVLLNRRRSGVDGIYRCEIPDSMNVAQTIYIGVYTTSPCNGE